MTAKCERPGCRCGLCSKAYDDLPPHTEPAPQSTCKCGIYAFHYPWEIEDQGATPYMGALGVIEASGRIILGTRGFRSEKARVVAITPYISKTLLDHDYDHKGDVVRTTLAKRAADHGVLFFDTMQELVRQFPHENISSLTGGK